jgi:hypothetical protein
MFDKNKIPVKNFVGLYSGKGIAFWGLCYKIFLLVIDGLASIIVSATTFSITTLSIIVFVCDTGERGN